jgi:hypothetical protein
MRNVTDEPARIHEIVIAGRPEAVLRGGRADPGPACPEWSRRFYETAERYGLTILDDWSNELKARYGITL